MFRTSCLTGLRSMFVRPFPRKMNASARQIVRLLVYVIWINFYVLSGVLINSSIQNILLEECIDLGLDDWSSPADRDQENSNSGLGMKILIYMTSHLSVQHKQFLSCWEDAIPRFRILRHADLMLYTSEIPTEQILKQLSGFKHVTVKLYDKRPKQAGAIQAMIDPWEQGWFEGYDWVIRLNPDVLIRNETWLLETMLNALDHGGEFDSPVALAVKCWGKHFHTDFIAFQPGQMIIDDFLNETKNRRGNAEFHMTRALARLNQQGRVQLIPGFIQKRACRLMGPNAPIIHHHDLASFCPNYYDKTNNETY